MLLETRIQQLLYREARLMDEHRYADWLALWDQDGVYWVPCNGGGGDPENEVSIIYDDYSRLSDRIARFESGTVMMQNPKTMMRRIVSNIEVSDTAERETMVQSNFLVVEVRGVQQIIWAGQSTHKLREAGGGLRICFKKVVLVNNDQELPSMQFLL
jgi:3-phenylpropionate/cinnamic acid dioxygenase small subunit